MTSSPPDHNGHSKKDLPDLQEEYSYADVAGVVHKFALRVHSDISGLSLSLVSGTTKVVGLRAHEAMYLLISLEQGGASDEAKEARKAKIAKIIRLITQNAQALLEWARGNDERGLMDLDEEPPPLEQTEKQVHPRLVDGIPMRQ